MSAGVLRHNRDFRLLWTGAGISALGGTVTTVTYPLLMIWQDGSAVRAGLVGFAALLPMLLLQLPAGVFVDRWDRRRVMITCDAVSFVTIGSVAISLLLGHLWLPHLLVVAFLEGSAQIFYRLSERAAVRNVVRPDDLPAALSQNEARGRAAGLLGQPLGSVLFALVRWAPFVFTALGHLVALVTLLLIRKDFQTERGPRKNLRAEIAEGVGWLLRQRFLRSAVLLVAVTNVLFQVLSLSLALIVKESGGSPAVIGVIGAASGVGGVLGAMSGSWFVRRLRPGMVIITVFAAWALLMPVVALTANPVVLGGLFAGMSFAGALINVMAGVYQVQVTPDEMQGRVGSVAGLLSSGANSFGALAAGFLLAAWGTGHTVLGVAAVMAAVAVTAWLTPVVRTTEYRERVNA
ncbi:MFS transporter [Lentzea sp.]|uniref:MFS transporter n=1 Tax=Lentzea sp. TaxID=56099 RepID=UPI002D1C93BD|nr:MFS transporter [Lentzea sp.]HUQ57174.1 MFS transporter [Lentzea sp.]